MVKRVLRI